MPGSDDTMLRDGLIPRSIHGIIEYLAGALLIAAPFLLAFDSGAAKAASIVLGVFVLAIAAATEGPTGLSAIVPIRMHVILDFALAGLMIAAPFLFGFSDEGAPTAFFVALGVLHLLITIGTRFEAGRQGR